MGMMVSDYDMNFLNSSYRFAAEKLIKTKALTESIFTPQQETDYINEDLDSLNNQLFKMDATKGFSAIALSLDGNPTEIKEILSKVSNGKYRNFLEKNVDGIVFGRNFESARTGTFSEELGGLAGEDASQTLTNGKFSKLIFVDTYNTAFNAVDAQTQNDQLFTQYSSMLSVLGNELHQAFIVDKGQTPKNNVAVYTYMKNAFDDIQSYLTNNGQLSFLSPSQAKVFSVALDLMSTNLQKEIDTQSNVNSGPARVVFTALA